jgi:hypothetical protein
VRLDTANKFLSIEGADGRSATLSEGDLIFRLPTGTVYKSVRRVVVGEAANGDYIQLNPGFYSVPQVIVGIKDGLLYDSTAWSIPQSFEAKATNVTAAGFNVSITHKKASSIVAKSVNITYGGGSYNGTTVYRTDVITTDTPCYRVSVLLNGGLKFDRWLYNSYLSGPYYASSIYRLSWRVAGSGGPFVSVGLVGAIPNSDFMPEWPLGAYPLLVEIKVEYMGFYWGQWGEPGNRRNEVWETPALLGVYQYTSEPTGADAVAVYMAIEGGVN